MAECVLGMSRAPRQILARHMKQKHAGWIYELELERRKIGCFSCINKHAYMKPGGRSVEAVRAEIKTVANSRGQGRWVGAGHQHKWPASMRALASAEGSESALPQMAAPPQKGERRAPSHQKMMPEEELTLRRGFIEEKIMEARGADKRM